MKSLFFYLLIILVMSCSPSKKTTAPAAIPTTPATVEGGGVDFIREKLDRGIAFYATGNEPGWSLEMHPESGFRFRHMDGTEFNTPMVREDQAMDAPVSRFHAIMESGEMIVTLFGQGCTDNMSGETFPYEVRVELKRGKQTSFTTYKGCGRYIFDQRLHDIWALESIDGKPITVGEGRPQRPYLEFQTTTGKVMGNTGCNQLSGPVQYKGNRIVFRPMAVTLTACPEGSYEGPFLQALAPGEVTYKIDQGRLYLYRGGKEVLMLRKVD